MRTGEIIAFLDLATCAPQATNNLLQYLSVEQRVIDLAAGQAKSCVLTDHYAYLSLISPQTLAKRAITLQSYADKVY